MILIALAADAQVLERIQKLVSATGAGKYIAEVPSIVIPKNPAQVVLFAEQLKPIAQHLAGISKMSAVLFEIE